MFLVAEHYTHKGNNNIVRRKKNSLFFPDGDVCTTHVRIPGKTPGKATDNVWVRIFRGDNGHETG